MQVQPYIFFNGRCEEALTFYREKLGAEVLFLTRFGEAPEPTLSQANPEKIMHATFKIGTSHIMACDTDGTFSTSIHNGFSLGISVDNASEGEKLFQTLSKEGQVQHPWKPTFWSKGFGMLTDKFGIPWMINVQHSPNAN